MDKSSLITGVLARKVFNSRGSPTIEVEVETRKGFGRALAPGGASTGIHEAVSYPDGGVTQAVKMVGDLIASKLIGVDANNQEMIDRLLHEIDNTKNFGRIGGNTSIAVSLAVAKSAASSYGIPLYRQISEKKYYELPHPLGNIIGGGKHAGKNAPDIQEFLSLPVEVVSFVESVEANIRVHAIVRELLESADGTFTGGKGDEGAWAPNVDNNTALDIVSIACERTAKELGVGIKVGLDVAASSFWDNKKQLYVYSREGVERETGEQVDYILNLIKDYKLAYVEDPLHEEDYEGFVEITKKAKNCLICGDDLFTTNTDRLEVGINLRAGNSIIIKPNQIGTLTDTSKTVRLAKSFQYVPVASHRSGETCDPYLAHLAVSYGCPIVKLGVVGGERLSKINELIRIEETLGDKTRMAELTI